MGQTFCLVPPSKSYAEAVDGASLVREGIRGAKREMLLPPRSIELIAMSPVMSEGGYVMKIETNCGVLGKYTCNYWSQGRT
jgi:hypothetical protein